MINEWAFKLAREYAKSVPDDIHVPTLARELQTKYRDEKEARSALEHTPLGPRQ
jgi:hypothetical protein